MLGLSKSLIIISDKFKISFEFADKVYQSSINLIIDPKNITM